jgi:glycosyltransferase involved in cell wall biosynthesis
MLDEKVSVIVPTLQKNTKILQTLVSILNADDAVSEIIIINNSIKPLSLQFISEKMKICTPSANMFVNISWNFGISTAKNDIFLIINDDIICCENLCSLILETGIFEDEQTGLIGIDNDYINNYFKGQVDEKFFSINKQLTVNDITLNKLDTYKKLYDWGSAFFGRKKSYFKIPAKFKILYGDNYLLKRNLEEGRICYKMTGLPFNHLHSLSSYDPEFWPICQQDYNLADDDLRNNK